MRQSCVALYNVGGGSVRGGLLGEKDKERKTSFPFSQSSRACISRLANREPGSITQSSRKSTWRKLGHPPRASVNGPTLEKVITLPLNYALVQTRLMWPVLIPSLQCTTDAALLSGCGGAQISSCLPTPKQHHLLHQSARKPQKCSKPDAFCLI